MTWNQKYDTEPGRTAALTRCLIQAQLLEESREEWSTSELAEICEIHPKTLRRDIRALKRAGWPITWTTVPIHSRGGKIGLVSWNGKGRKKAK